MLSLPVKYINQIRYGLVEVSPSQSLVTALKCHDSSENVLLPHASLLCLNTIEAWRYNIHSAFTASELFE